MTGTVAPRRPQAVPATTERDGVGLAARVREARDRLDPPAVTVPAPRSAAGVVPAPALRVDPHAPSKELLAELDGFTAELAAVESPADGADGAAHRVLCRIVDLVADGVPEAGWSATEEIDVELLRATSDAARALHGRAAALLATLDEQDRPGPAAAVGSLVTTLQVVQVVADLELFERARR
ncbi:hypothetical protein [Actinomycetospora atypica]|uniref:Uncharacterized protein n=1 Tax=Actinomycetospora atypica TaxID=1290095 RepID=A0ABV9YW34_9PSEU